MDKLSPQGSILSPYVSFPYGLPGSDVLDFDSLLFTTELYYRTQEYMTII